MHAAPHTDGLGPAGLDGIGWMHQPLRPAAPPQPAPWRPGGACRLTRARHVLCRHVSRRRLLELHHAARPGGRKAPHLRSEALPGLCGRPGRPGLDAQTWRCLGLLRLVCSVELARPLGGRSGRQVVLPDPTASHWILSARPPPRRVNDFYMDRIEEGVIILHALQQHAEQLVRRPAAPSGLFRRSVPRTRLADGPRELRDSLMTLFIADGVRS